MAQIQTPAIVTFSNQKGGVGKTTLCACFANYLVGMGVRVRVIDCDAQLSIAKCRRRDIRKYGEGNIPYPIDGYRNMSREVMRGLISEIFDNGEMEVVLFDCPGNMTDNWLLPLFANADIMVIPFYYDDVTVTSTSEFILGVEQINERLNRENPPRLYMIPNITDKRIGTLDELRKWEKVRETYERHGTVTPKITRKADMQRFSTIIDLDKQFNIVKPAFDKIYYELFGTVKPLRDAIPTLRSKDLPKPTEDSAADEADEDEDMELSEEL